MTTSARPGMLILFRFFALAALHGRLCFMRHTCPLSCLCTACRCQIAIKISFHVNDLAPYFVVRNTHLAGMCPICQSLRINAEIGGGFRSS